MTWLELMDELRKQPHYLLEEEVGVWCNVGTENNVQDDYFENSVVELTSPLNSGNLGEWVRHPDYHLTLVVDLKIDELKSLRGMKED